MLAPHFRVVTYDQRGHGASAAASDYSLDAFLAGLQAVLGTLALEHPLLVGHSLGGLLAVQHAAAGHDCAGVEVEAQLDRPATRLLSRVVTAVGMGVRLSFAELQRVADEAADREDRLEEAYARLTCPLLVVLAAKADPAPQGKALLAAVDAAATRFRQRHPQVKLARLASGQHIPLERPRELADLIGRFAAAADAVASSELTRPPMIRGFALCLPLSVRLGTEGRAKDKRWRPIVMNAQLNTGTPGGSPS